MYRDTEPAPARVPRRANSSARRLASSTTGGERVRTERGAPTRTTTNPRKPAIGRAAFVTCADTGIHALAERPPAPSGLLHHGGRIEEGEPAIGRAAFVTPDLPLPSGLLHPGGGLRRGANRALHGTSSPVPTTRHRARSLRHSRAQTRESTPLAERPPAPSGLLTHGGRIEEGGTNTRDTEPAPAIGRAASVILVRRHGNPRPLAERPRTTACPTPAHPNAPVPLPCPERPPETTCRSCAPARRPDLQMSQNVAECRTISPLHS